MQGLQEAGKRAGWICFYCHKKVSTTIAVNHPLHAVVIPHPSGDETVAHRKCVDRAQPNSNSEVPMISSPAAFKEAAQNIREASSLRAEMTMISDLLDMAGVPAASTVSERISSLLEEYVETKERAAGLASQRSADADLQFRALTDKAARLESEGREVKQQLTDLREVHERVVLQVRDGEDARRRLAALAEALRAVMAPTPGAGA